MGPIVVDVEFSTSTLLLGKNICRWGRGGQYVLFVLVDEGGDTFH